MGAGTGAGLGIRGYYNGKQMRDQSRQTDYTFDRDKMLDEILDPIEIRSAERRDEQSEMERPNDQANVDFDQRAREQKARRGIRNDESSEYAKKNDRNVIDRQESGAARDEQADIVSQPGRISGIRRDEEIANREHPGRMKAVDYNDRAAERRDKIGGMVANQQEQQYDDQQKIRGAQDADQLVEISGSPQAFDDFYDEFFPNTPGTTTTEDPDVPGGYIITMDDGQVHKAESMEQLRQGFMQTFTNPEIVNRLSGYGNIGQNRGGYGGVRGSRSSGYRGGPAPSTEKERTVDDINQLLLQMPENEGRNPAEVRLEAYQIAVQRGAIDPVVAERKVAAELYKIYAENSYDDEDRDSSMQRAKDDARELMRGGGNNDDIGAILDAAMGEG